MAGNPTRVPDLLQTSSIDTRLLLVACYHTHTHTDGQADRQTEGLAEGQTDIPAAEAGRADLLRWLLVDVGSFGGPDHVFLARILAQLEGGGGWREGLGPLRVWGLGRGRPLGRLRRGGRRRRRSLVLQARRWECPCRCGV